MSEMVDRVAKAIRRVVSLSEDWDRIGTVAQNMYRKDARAAIEALEVPTDAMIQAAKGNEERHIIKDWRAMIREALK